MRWVRFGSDTAPRFTAFGVLTPAGVGAGPLAGAGSAVPAAEVTIDLPALCDEPPLRFRRFDRYGELGYAAARVALRARRAGGRPLPGAAEPADPGIGVFLGSSLACWASNVRHHRESRDPAATQASPATFVRTVANAVNGDLSIALRLGGPGALFASGWTAGAEAIMAAGSALAEGRARAVLAGGVEAPGPDLSAMHVGGDAQSAGRWFSGMLAEGAALAMMESAAEAAGDLDEARDAEPARDARAAGPLRLHAYGRAHDPEQRISLATLLDAPATIPFGAVVIANTMPSELLERARVAAGPRPVVHLPDRTGELGAAGAPAAVALAEALAGALAGGEGVLVVTRDLAGGVAALALGP
jgi:Beta-ketoacyl synthase, N-terminal domain